ncbi:MAG: hypothetical protein KF791_20390 [Verrucomicrobiae bacterium]|nr:hypothetical protein [Verrucomicrobiae bacterium]
MKNRVTRLVPIVIGLGLLAVFGISKYSQRERETFNREKRTRAHQIIENWEKEEYVNIDSSPQFQELLFARLTVQAGEDVPSDPGMMSDSLKRALISFLVAFNDGTYEAFRRFRTPVRHIISEETQSLMRQSLESDVPIQVFLPPTNAAPGERRSIRRVLKTASELELSVPERVDADELDRLCFTLVSQGTLFRGYITGVCLNRSELRIDSSRELISPIQQVLAKFPEELGTTLWGSGYTPVVTPDQILSRSGRIIYATCQLLIRPAPRIGRSLSS